MSARTPFVGGNWKMNLTRHAAVDLLRAIVREDPTGSQPAGRMTGGSMAPIGGDARTGETPVPPQKNITGETPVPPQKFNTGGTPVPLSASGSIEVAVFPAFVHLDAAAATLALAKSPVALGAQDAWPEPDGAYTGEISIAMLQDLGVSAVLVGHSERRHVVGEAEDLIARKTRAVLDAGVTCVLCVGETLDQRDAGVTDRVNESQTRSALAGVTLADPARLVVAYEPVWAIGTGRTATPADAQAAHARLRAVLADVLGSDAAGAIRIIYGGSVKPDNARELFARPDIDGGLIGGASLDHAGFLTICGSARGATPQAHALNPATE